MDGSLDARLKFRRLHSVVPLTTESNGREGVFNHLNTEESVIRNVSRLPDKQKDDRNDSELAESD